jgi:Family of unknown function (DUF6284)
VTTHDLADLDGPSPEDLAAIQAEGPLIEAGLTLLDAEIHIYNAYPEPTALDWQRMRRAEALVMRELVKVRRPTDLAARRSLPSEVA